MQEILIGLSGAMGSGKDTVADILESEHGFTRFAFADTLKELLWQANCTVAVTDKETAKLGIAHSPSSHTMIRSLFPQTDLPPTPSEWDEIKQINDVRRLLQEHGTASRQVLGDTIWVDIVSRKIDAANPNRVVITDVRFPNELDFIRKNGGRMLAIDRLKSDKPAEVDSSLLEHTSEISLKHDTMDMFLSNNSTLDNLRRKVAQMVSELVCSQKTNSQTV